MYLLNLLEASLPVFLINNFHKLIVNIEVANSAAFELGAPNCLGELIKLLVGGWVSFDLSFGLVFGIHEFDEHSFYCFLTAKKILK